jgi:hypothetical protein
MDDAADAGLGREFNDRRNGSAFTARYAAAGSPASR